MASWTGTIGAAANEQTNLTDWSPSTGSRPGPIPAGLVQGGATAFFAYLRLFNVATGTVRFFIAANQTDSASASGPDLTSEWEAGGSFTIAAGSLSFTFNVTDGDASDVAEPYQWNIATGSDRVLLASFITAYIALSDAEKAATTITLDDGATPTLVTGDGNPLEVEASLGEATGTAIAPLQLSDFDTTGLDVDVLALIEAATATTIYADSTRGGTQTPGDVDSASDMTISDISGLISRILVQSSGTNLLVNTRNQTSNQQDHFGDDDTTSDWTLTIQTDDGIASTSSIGDIGGGFSNWMMNAASATILNGISAGDRVIVAFTRAAVVEVTGAGNPLVVNASLGDATGQATPPINRAGSGNPLIATASLGDATGTTTPPTLRSGDANPLEVHAALGEATGTATPADERTGDGNPLEVAVTLGQATGTATPPTLRSGDGNPLEVEATLGDATGIATPVTPRFGDGNPLTVNVSLGDATGRSIAPGLTWDILKNGTDSIGSSVLPGLTAKRGMTAGRTGLVPWAGSMSFLMDELLLVTGDQVEFLRGSTVEWTGRVRDVSQTRDRQVNDIRWKIGAQGRLAQVIQAEVGASTERYDDISVAAALGHTLDAIGIAAGDRDIGPSSRMLSYWQLTPDLSPWAEIQRLLWTAGPRARLYEDRLGRLVFRDAALPALSRTIYGLAIGTGPRPILTDKRRDDIGRDRVVNVARVPYATTPTPLAVAVPSNDWGIVELAGNPVTATIDGESPERTEGLVIVGYGAAADGASGAMRPEFEAQRPAWTELYGETWDSDYGSTASGSQSITFSTGSITMTQNPHITTIDTEDIGDFGIGTPTSVSFTTSTPASMATNIPAGATNVRISVASISTRRLFVYVDTNGNYNVIAGDATLADLDADRYVTITRSGSTVTVTPVTQPTFLNSAQLAEFVTSPKNWVGRYTVELNMTWDIGVIDTTWAGLYLGAISDQPDAALDLPSISNVMVRGGINALRLSIANGIRPVRVSAGDAVLAGTTLVAACVVESRIDDPVTITVPTGWTQVTGEPTGLDSLKTRRILFVATRTLTADGTVPAATWSAAGPSNPMARSVIFAVGPARTVVWEDDAGARVVPATGLHIDIMTESPLIHLIAPIEGLDFTVEAGTVTSTSVTTTGVEGAAARITIMGTGATIANLQLRGHAIVTGESETRMGTTSIATYGRSASRRRFAQYLTETTAGALAGDIVAYSDEPRDSWETVLDGDRSTENMDAALLTDIRDVQRVAIDNLFDQQGEVVRIEHRVTTPAGLLNTRLTMLGIGQVTIFDNLLLESGDHVLYEDGDNVRLEG